MMYYEILRSGQQPSKAKDKAMGGNPRPGESVWLETNAALFKHVLDYEAKLEKFLNKLGVDQGTRGAHLDENV